MKKNVPLLLLVLITSFYSIASTATSLPNMENFAEKSIVYELSYINIRIDSIRKIKELKNPFLKFGERVLYSTSLTYIPQTGYYKELIYHELTWYNSISFNINKSIYLGFHYLAIYSSGSIISKNRQNNSYRIYGAKIQYDFLPRFENRLFFESSLNIGNYCTCGSFDPYKIEDLIYFGLGFGYDYPVYKRVSIRLGFTNYVILQDLNSKYNYSQYILGLNINISNETKRNIFKLSDVF